MEALSSSAAAGRILLVVPLTTPRLRCSSWLLRIEGSGALGGFEPLRLSRRSGSGAIRLRAIAHDVYGESSEDDGALENGFCLSPLEFSSPVEINSGHSHEGGLTEDTEMATPVTVGRSTSASRAGLFRTPISGGVQSATLALDLPHPAVAVRNLMEQARCAHLCTIMSRMNHRQVGYPFGSLVEVAPDSLGHPIFSLSPLSIHTRNLMVDPRCTLIVQTPGWSGLSNARVTIFGDVTPLPADQQEWAHKKFITKHQQWPSQQWGNFYYYRMQNISDIYFIGGFGTVAWINVKEYEALQPDKVAVDGEQNLKELNAIFSKPLQRMLSREGEIDDAVILSIDRKGANVRVRQGTQYNIQRLSFEVKNGVETLEDARKALQKTINHGGRSKSNGMN